MKEIAKEVNKIAEEIKSFNIDGIGVKASTIREQISSGQKILYIEGLKIAFLRFYNLVDTELLSKTSINLFGELNDNQTQIEKFLNGDKDLPKEVQEYLNKEVG